MSPCYLKFYAERMWNLHKERKYANIIFLEQQKNFSQIRHALAAKIPLPLSCSTLLHLVAIKFQEQT